LEILNDFYENQHNAAFFNRLFVFTQILHGVTLAQSKFETCVESLDSRGFFDEAGYEDDPGKKIFQFFSKTGHQLAMPFWCCNATLRRFRNPQRLGYILF
jgi:hypothetical protein